MERNTAFEIVKKTLIYVCGVGDEEVTATAVLYNDLGADELDIVEVGMKIERELKIVLPDEDDYWNRMRTVDDFVSLVHKIANEPHVNYVPPVHITEAQGEHSMNVPAYHSMNIPCGLPNGDINKVELKAGVEVYCHTVHYWADGTVSDAVGWHKVAQDPGCKDLYIEKSGWVIGAGYGVDKHFDLTNPRNPEAREEKRTFDETDMCRAYNAGKQNMIDVKQKGDAAFVSSDDFLTHYKLTTPTA